MSKAEIIAAIHQIVVQRLFVSSHWLCDFEALEAIDRQLTKLGLQEQVAPDTTRTTDLGRQLDLDLMLVFMGIMHEIEACGILADRGLLPDDWEQWPEWDEDDPEPVLRPVVQKAYREIFAIKHLH